MTSRKNTLGLAVSTFAGIAFACISLSGSSAHSAPATEMGSAARLYPGIAPDQIEQLSSGDRIKAVTAQRNSMSAIWETLEEGEKVECLDCIPSVAPLMYDADPRTREIAAWWLRRRIFGVFGPGEVYEQTVNTLANDPNPRQRAYAAEALGEFLVAPGVEAVGIAIERDSDPTVRAAAASALGRLNDEGRGALSKALGDADARVKLAALASATRVNSFSDVVAVARVLGDADASVRRRGAEVLGALGAKDAVLGLVALAKTDPDAGVRNAACHTLGELGDARARDVLEELLQTDADELVRGQAAIALRRLR
jgi:HEAT repeat protein